MLQLPGGVIYDAWHWDVSLVSCIVRYEISTEEDTALMFRDSTGPGILATTLRMSVYNSLCKMAIIFVKF